MNAIPARGLTWSGQLARMLAWASLGYWALFALLAPVTVWDAQVYNLGRLPLAEIGGLWSNPLWTSERQVAFPLTFDAIHLPFLHLGAGFALPSFSCFLGTLAVAWSTLRRWHGPDAAWLGILVLLALPSLAFQAVATKNDVAVLFGFAVWFHALGSWRRAPAMRHLVFAAIAIGFMAGAKSSGLIPAFFALLASGWIFRRTRAAFAIFTTALLLSLATLGSVETYVMARRAYGHPLGPEAFVRDHRNNDRLKGAAANTIRYVAANLSTGAEPWLETDMITPWWEQRCRSLLASLRLANVGYRRDYNDTQLRFNQVGWDSASDYGPLGTLALGVALLALGWWRPREMWWQVAVAAWLLLGAVAYSVAWMPWNNRFLLAPFALLSLATVSLAWRPGWRALRWPLLALAVYSVVAYPLTSFNKRPSDLAGAILRREAQEFKERPGMQRVVAAVREWRERHPDGEVLMLAGSDSWVLPFLTPGRQAVSPVSAAGLEPHILANVAKNIPTAVLILNRADFRRGELPLAKITSFTEERDTFLYAATAPSEMTALAMPFWRSGSYADGWTAPTAELNLEGWMAGSVRISLWNPTPLVRTVKLVSSLEKMEFLLQPSERVQVQVRTARTDSLKLEVNPEFIPKAAGLADDSRRLGVHVTLEE
jgi:hypothetical protein